jgi:ABC-type lipoprotein release transport system permease subunit
MTKAELVEFVSTHRGTMAMGIVLALALLLVLALLAVGRVPLGYNLRNLTIRWKTTLMTAMAFTLVISLLTVMLAFVNGMRRLTENTGRADNILILSDGSTDEVFSNLSIDDIAGIEQLKPIVRNDEGKPLASRETFMTVNQVIPNSGQNGLPKRRFVQLRGLQDPAIAATIHDVALLPGGHWFSASGVGDDTGKGAPPVQAVLGLGIARELGRDRTAAEKAAAANSERLDVGDTFVLGDRDFVVVGLLDAPTSTFTSEIWAKQSVVGPHFGKTTYTTLLVRTADAESAQKFKHYLAKQYTRAAVAPEIEATYYANLSETSNQFLFAIIFVTVIMSIGGALGVMNTMFATISQRIKDIGVLRLLGYSPVQILSSFLLESLAIALIGGALGCALGTMANGWSANSVVTSSGGGGKTVLLTLVVDSQIVLFGIMLSLMMGGIGGLIPSISAMRTKPLESLR